MINRYVFAFCAVLLLRYPAELDACTAFNLQNGKGIWIGKNFDWPIDDGMLVINPRRAVRCACVPGDSLPLTWVARTGSLTFNQLGEGFPLGGMNEEGLVVEVLAYSPSRYPQPDSRPAVNELQWVQYQLDCCASVEQVIASESVLRLSRLLIHLHFFVADRYGQTAAIEFIDGEMQVFSGSDLPVPALTNNSYPKALAYLRRHIGFGGDLRVHGGPESPERFVRAAIGLQNAAQTPETDGWASAFALLNSVRQSDTQWSIVYDPLNLEIRFITADRDLPACILLPPLLIACPAPAQALLIERADQAPAPPLPFHPLAAAENSALLVSVFQQLVALQDLQSDQAETLLHLIGAEAAADRCPDSQSERPCRCRQTRTSNP